MRTAASTIFAQEGFDTWLTALRDPRPTEKNKTRTLLEKQLGDYTAKNSFDYFIHKDLRGFLRRELDFFIKNEVLQLDDLETEGDRPAPWRRLARVRAMRGVAHKIIEMLAQIRELPKKALAQEEVCGQHGLLRDARQAYRERAGAFG